MGLTLMIAIPTYRRPIWLGRLLDSFEHCETPADIELSVAVCVIDNDPARSAFEVTRSREGRLAPWRLIYLHESTPGVVAVRNRALAASCDSGLLAFVDDDEVVSPRWLRELVRVQTTFGANVVFGPVAPMYEPGAPDWVRRLRPHQRRITKDGRGQEVRGTYNCLIDRRYVAHLGLRFDERMATIGAEDTLFFTEMKERGALFADAASASCREHIPAVKSSLRWLLLRWSRTGATDHMIAARHRGATASKIAALPKGALRIVVGGTLLVVFSPAMMVKGLGAVAGPLRTVARGCGMIAYAFGGIFEDYSHARSR